MAGEFQSLLRVKTEQALAEMRKDLERTLYNESPILNHLEKNMEPIYASNPPGNNSAPLPTHGSIVSEAMAELKRERAKAVATDLGDHFNFVAQPGRLVEWYYDDGSQHFAAIAQEHAWLVTGYTGAKTTTDVIEIIVRAVIDGRSVYFEGRDEAL